tara:strand:+ start:9521 stop:11734 length:2214 start_codon:yes stop_codon:yes gene_type:complete
MTKLRGSYLCNIFYLILIALSVLFTFINRKIDTDLWPVPDNVVLHNVIPFDSDNQLYKMFAKSEGDLLKLIYDEKTDTAMEASSWNLDSLEVMQYISGCYPQLVLKTTTHSILSGDGNVGKLESATGALVGDTTINLSEKIAKLEANDHLAVYTKKTVGEEYVYNLEVVKVTAGQAGTTLTVVRNQDLSSSGITSNGLANIPSGTYVYRIATGDYGENFQQPYVIKSLAKDDIQTDFDTAVAAATTAGRSDSALCTCLYHASKIETAYKADLAAETTVVEGLFDALATEATADTQFGNVLSTGTNNPHTRKGVRTADTIKEAIKVFKADLKKGNQAQFKIRAVDSCLATHIPEYTVKYKGVIDTRHIGDNGQYFMYLGILTVVLNMLYVWTNKGYTSPLKDAEGKYTGESDPEYKNFSERVFAQILVVSIAVLGLVLLILNYAVDNHSTHCDATDDNNGHCNTKRDLLNNREGTYEQPYLVLTMLYQNTTTFSYFVIFIFASFRAFAMLTGAKKNDAGDWENTLYFDYHKLEGAIPRRIGTDLPFIAGYACMGTALLAQSGVQDLTSLMFSFTVLFITGFMQHISNVCKIMYDSLCKKTSPEAMTTIFQKKEGDNTYAGCTLQFFGWSRLFMFATIGLATLSLMTMTREVVESNHVQTFTNGQVFYFALAFFWSNIGYDVVRELIPFTFERIHMDHSKALITGLYLLYYNLSMYWFVDQIKDNAEINQFSLHGARTM